jgi:asparagine synthase (glutamine-hydrolysing)
MNSAINHRGPDCDGYFLDENVTIGNVRLSINDLSEAGRQPFSNEDGSLKLTYNGEIYNFPELRENLESRGHQFKSHTDTEVILHAYEEFGFKCANEFNGMWAFALYDERNHLIFLSRDRFGIKPLYYALLNNGIIFSSEIKGILCYDMPRMPNETAVYHFLAYGLTDYSNKTFFKGIYRLMPGENIIFDLTSKNLKKSKWYDLRTMSRSDFRDWEAIITGTRELFRDCISKCLISDVPVGSCLSGGIDSSSIVSLMSELKKDARIDTFSLVFPGLEIDESQFIDKIVEKYTVCSHRMSLTIKDVLTDLQDLIITQEEPFQSLSVYGQYKVMELANKCGEKVLLDGQGADEVLGGYPAYHLNLILGCLIERKFSDALNSYRANKIGLLEILGKIAFLALDRFAFSRKALNGIRRIGLYYLNIPSSKEIVDFPLRLSSGLNEALLMDLTLTSIPSLLRYEDKNSMRWSIESRVPFLDYRLVESLIFLNPNLIMKDGMTKTILKESMKGALPIEIINRGKIPFATPDSLWMKSTDFVNFVSKIIESQTFKERPYWKHNEVFRMLKRHVAGEKDNSQVIWRILSVELWLRQFIDKQQC